ncbi:aspartyl/glutamyl-tRNA(Asn/Gln) amidotransferase subunit C [Planctomycetales bacterium]|nr:aspartyl/glutamyl-tRNA(Asn/Gln) amidotransferase subunit C [Planctomycetales bacterium]GHS96437.1 aspartyl/glutamyl-tRNA(Asn/Gln) amidotransferase subunit C [Planctomycetales bacterium]GHT02971.1 aspartyl/glutamyl-tRNA(Asn/Gln) amidotransferase subunit C [Planctomycetales bacterium]GHV21318.1 aspartyl/glutamyl-tRNA(Asn/Gln) amidotransferase subunit C [Planctomycetales bacterium]
MSAINADEIQKIATLARLEMDAAERAKSGEQLARILNYVATLTEADVTGVEPFCPPTVNETTCRADRAGTVLSRAQALQNAPQTDSQFFQVPVVVK